MLLPTLVLLLAVVLYVAWRNKNWKLFAISKELPGPPTLPLLGNANIFFNRNIIEVIQFIRLQYGDLARVWLGPDLNIIAGDPEDLKVLLTSPKTSAKGIQYKYMADVLGGGILSGSGVTYTTTVDVFVERCILSITGPVWRRHRKIATPNYGKRAVESFTDTFNDEADLLLKKLEGLVEPGKAMDVYRSVVQTTSYTVCQCLMGLTREETLKLPHLQAIIDTTPDMYDVVFERMTIWYQQIEPVFWMTNSHKSLKLFQRRLNDFSKTIIRHREEKLKMMKLDDKIDDMMNSEEDSKSNTMLSVIDRFILSEELDPMELVHETFTIFTSSQEATAKITSFLLLMMAYHPECQERLYKEIVLVVGDEQGPVTEEQLRQMPYLEMVFKEIIRMFPIGALLQRSVIEDITISKTTIPAGCSLVIPIYHIQRDPRFWKNPDAFDPDRFTPENSKNRPAHCYVPFSLGPMDCLGRHFGTKLVKTIAIKILKNYKITSNETYNDMKLIIAISVTSVDGFKIILTPRNSLNKKEL